MTCSYQQISTLSTTILSLKKKRLNFSPSRQLACSQAPSVQTGYKVSLSCHFVVKEFSIQISKERMGLGNVISRHWTATIKWTEQRNYSQMCLVWMGY